MKIRERYFKWFFQVGDWYRIFVTWVSGLCRFFFVISLIMFIICLLYYIGFEYSEKTFGELLSLFRLLFPVIFFSKYIPEIIDFKWGKRIPLILRAMVFLFTLTVLLINLGLAVPEKEFWKILSGPDSVIVATALLVLPEIASLLKLLNNRKVPPALIFSSGFLIIILVGSGLLLLPKAHTGTLTFLDSLFTSVSAVCVTGLVVVDTATTFTGLGKIIILCLIQIGGLGIMTFTGFFSYIFTPSGASFRDRVLLKEIFSSESMNNLYKLLAKILILTFLTEFAGAIIIYLSLDQQFESKMIFAVFHSVSAFCNAGFSTMTDGLQNASLRYNNSVLLSVSILIIMGGIGFPVLVNLYSFIKRLILMLMRKIQGKSMPALPEKRNISTRLVLTTTALLILAGTCLYYYFELDYSMKGADETRKIVSSFFGSVSARTAGFNIVDISLWSYPTIFLMILLMWIGASPGSTGGGIKTSTFAIAVLSVWKNIRGKDHLVYGNRELSNLTVTRLLSIIMLSLIIIATGFFLLLLSEPDKNPIHLLFESVSAFGTVGLSIAGTSGFSDAGKIIVMLLMFIGRVGPLTLLTGFLYSSVRNYSRYPEQDIVIN